MNKLVYIYAYFGYHDIFYSLHFGFRQKCSTTIHALISMTESVQFGCGIFIDFKKKKAFDTLNHSILRKLHHYGIRGKSLRVVPCNLTAPTENGLSVLIVMIPTPYL